jgi:D-serine deaminase-like pyridoxal phosphate-dependent protein
MRLADVPTPALLLDLRKLERNLERMAERASRLGVRLRPHVKTHKSIEVARRQLALGARGITVSTLYEAEVFAAAGFDDITWAYPLILQRLPEVLALADRVDLAVVVDSREAVDLLAAQTTRLRVFLKVDCGYHRAGVDPEGELLLELADRLATSRLRFAGILTHAGHAYHRRGREALLAVAGEERDVMTACAARLRDRGIPVPTVSIGSTPTLSVAEDLGGIDEIRPGNYAFYDLSQVILGSCTVTDCALTVAASVVSCQPGATHSIVDAGALALSKDPGPTDLGHSSMGAVFADYEAGALSTDLELTGLSQEHGHLAGRLDVGRRVRILPNHSCLTAAQFDEYLVVDGEHLVDRWPVRRGRTTPAAAAARPAGYSM